MATLATYTTKVQNEVEDTSSRAKNIIEQAIQDVYQEILNFTVEELAGTTSEDVVATASQRYITTVNTYQDIQNVLWKPTSSDSKWKLARISEQDYYDFHVNRTTGDPMAYYLNLQNVYFDVAPSNAGTVTVSGVKVQDELAGAVVSIIPERFEQVILKGAVAHFKAYEGVPDAGEYFNLYRGRFFEQGRVGGALKNMIDQLKSRQERLQPALYNRKANPFNSPSRA